MVKRKKFLLTSFLLSVGILITQQVGENYRYISILILGVISYFLSAWALWEDLKGSEWFNLLSLPTLYTVSVALIYFILPNWLKLLALISFGVGMYLLLLTENIFSVAKIKTIQLLRTAHVAGFGLTLATGLILYDVIMSFRLSFWVNFILVFVVSFPLVTQGVWSAVLNRGAISKRVLFYGLLISLGIAELAVVLSFWPSSIWAVSTFLVSALYVSLGITQQHFMGRLFRKTLDEYLRVGVAVFVIMLITSML